jgi:Mrp family chromosome partitioning ATPase
MTTLDKVFLRAYDKRAKGPGPAATSGSDAHVGPRIDAAHALAAQVSLDPRTDESPPPIPEGFFQPPDQGRIDVRHEKPAPHWKLPAEPASEPAAEPAAEPMRAAYEVDRFLWPDACRRMLSTGDFSEIGRELSAAAREGQQVFLITSQQRGEGRTMLAFCLAQQLAQSHLRVTLIDADFRQPQLARQFKLLPACTWDDVLRGPLPLAESWIESVEDGVTLLPLKERADTTGLTGNPRLKELLATLRRTSDVVLIDAGSLADFTDREVAALLAGTAQIDRALLVRDVRKTTADEAAKAAQCLDGLGIGRVEVVENFVR